VVGGTQIAVAPIIPNAIHDLLRWSDWGRACRATAEFFDRKLPVSPERQ
jgi:hypothetical protein